MPLKTYPRARHATRSRSRSGGVEGNSRFTASLALILFVLLAVEGVTVVFIGSLFTAHVFVGVVLIAPVMYKIGSAGWRFIKYYRRDPAYRRKGPPPLFLRMLGPVVVVLTIVVLGSGVGLIVLSRPWRTQLLLVHQASFLLWFAAMTIHVVSHMVETARLAPRDWFRHSRREVNGASVRQWTVATSLVLGVLAAVLITPLANGWLFQNP